jgi:hypothetical protein
MSGRVFAILLFAGVFVLAPAVVLLSVLHWAGDDYEVYLVWGIVGLTALYLAALLTKDNSDPAIDHWDRSYWRLSREGKDGPPQKGRLYPDRYN